MKVTQDDGFIKSDGYLGARSCPYCAAYSVNGHLEHCPWLRLYVENRDLKARLREVKRLNHGPDWRNAREVINVVANLRVKNWKPDA